MNFNGNLNLSFTIGNVKPKVLVLREKKNWKNKKQYSKYSNHSMPLSLKVRNNCELHRNPI